jgi:hypothetical protein
MHNAHTRNQGVHTQKSGPPYLPHTHIHIFTFFRKYNSENEIPRHTHTQCGPTLDTQLYGFSIKKLFIKIINKYCSCSSYMNFF